MLPMCISATIRENCAGKRKSIEVVSTTSQAWWQTYGNIVLGFDGADEFGDEGIYQVLVLSNGLSCNSK